VISAYIYPPRLLTYCRQATYQCFTARDAVGGLSVSYSGPRSVRLSKWSDLLQLKTKMDYNGPFARLHFWHWRIKDEWH